jgi:hypothetical protein
LMNAATLRALSSTWVVQLGVTVDRHTPGRQVRTDPRLEQAELHVFRQKADRVPMDRGVAVVAGLAPENGVAREAAMRLL